MLLRQLARWPIYFARESEGSRSAARIAMMAITTSNSINVNASESVSSVVDELTAFTGLGNSREAPQGCQGGGNPRVRLQRPIAPLCRFQFWSSWTGTSDNTLLRSPLDKATFLLLDCARMSLSNQA